MGIFGTSRSISDSWTLSLHSSSIFNDSLRSHSTGCGLDTANGEKSTVDWTVKSPNGITPTSVPSSISFDFHKCGYQTLKCDGHTEKFPEQFPPPATGGGVLSLMVGE